MRQTHAVLVVVTIAVVTLTSGCAFGTRHATITYPPDTKPAKVAPATVPPASMGRIIVKTFDDDRADKEVIGHVRNGFGMKTAKVVSEGKDLGALVTEAVAAELAKAGYDVVRGSVPDEKEVPSISGSLTKAYCDAYMTYEGAVGITVRMHRDGQEVFRRSYEGKGSVGMNWGATGASYGRSLSLALADAIDAMKRDLPTALKQ